MCALHDFFSGKVRFIYTSTVTRSHSCYGKNYAYASRTSCFANSAKSNMYNNQSCNITKKMYMYNYNCIPTNMLEFHPIDFLDQDHDTLLVP